MTKGTKADGEKIVDTTKCLGECHVEAVGSILVASQERAEQKLPQEKTGWLEWVNLSVEVGFSSTGGKLDCMACKIPSSLESLWLCP